MGIGGRGCVGERSEHTLDEHGMPMLEGTSAMRMNLETSGTGERPVLALCSSRGAGDQQTGDASEHRATPRDGGWPRNSLYSGLPCLLGRFLARWMGLAQAFHNRIERPVKQWHFFQQHRAAAAQLNGQCGNRLVANLESPAIDEQVL